MNLAWMVIFQMQFTLNLYPSIYYKMLSNVLCYKTCNWYLLLWNFNQCNIWINLLNWIQKMLIWLSTCVKVQKRAWHRYSTPSILDRGSTSVVFLTPSEHLPPSTSLWSWGRSFPVCICARTILRGFRGCQCLVYSCLPPWAPLGGKLAYKFKQYNK